MTEEEIALIVQRVLAEVREGEVPSQQAIDNTHFAVAPGQTILADHMNSVLNQSVPKYASLALIKSDWTTRPVGALAYANDTNILYVYDSQILGGTVDWRPVGGLRMGYGRMGLNQKIPKSNDTLVTLDAAGGVSGKAGRATWAADGTVKVPITGTYLVNGSVCWPSNTTGERRVYIRRYDGTNWTFTSVAGGASETNSPGSSYLRQSISAQIYMNANEKLGLWVFHTATVDLTLVGGSDQAKLAVHLLGAD